MHGKIVIGVAGMPGAGKATAEELFREKGYPIIVMGDEVREEAKRRNLEPTPQNLGKVMLQIRAEEGPAVLAKRCIPKIKAAKSEIVVVDGIRSPHEVDEFKRAFKDFVLIAIHASPKTRFKRLLRRSRSDDPRDWEAFIARDRRELSVGLGEVIATADYVVVNEGTRRHLINELKRILWMVIGNE
ncbi:MAG: AAA family ATPase [Candidatus Bathyarchaeia archaeon]